MGRTKQFTYSQFGRLKEASLVTLNDESRTADKASQQGGVCVSMRGHMDEEARDTEDHAYSSYLLLGAAVSGI